MRKSALALLLCLSPLLVGGRSLQSTHKQNLRHQQDGISSGAADKAKQLQEQTEVNAAESREDQEALKKTKALLEVNRRTVEVLDAKLADMNWLDSYSGGVWAKLPLPGRPYYKEHLVADMENAEKESYTLNVALAQLEAKDTPTGATANMSKEAAKKLKARLKYLEDLKNSAPSLLIFQTILGLFMVVMVLFLRGYFPMVRALQKKDAPATSLYARLFLKHRNAKFAANYELAFRGALFALLVGLPFFWYNHPWEAGHEMVHKGYYSSLAIVYFLYTLYKSVGETLHFAYCGLMGTIFAVLNAWVLYGFFPDGVSESTEPHVFWIGLVNGMLFVMAFLVLNVELSTAIFALSTWVWFWMAFLEPTPDNFSAGFQIRLRGTAINNLIQCGVGCLVAILATLIPYPIWAIDKAKKTASEVDEALIYTWNNYLTAFSVVSGSAINMAKVVKTTKGLRATIDTLRGHLDNSWWECFGLGRRQKVRLMLRRLDNALYESYDILSGSQNALCSDSGPKREKMMNRLKKYIKDVVDEGAGLMAKCTEYALDGDIDADEARDVSERILRTKRAIETLTRHFEEAKKEIGIAKLSDDLIDEHVFCFAVCAFGRIAFAYAEDALADRDGSKKFVEPAGSSIFDRSVLMDKDHINYALRNSISMFLCFLVGFEGYGTIIGSHNAGIAGVMALLLSKSMGSAMKANLGRLQGVVLGTIVGQILYAVFGWCAWWGVLAMSTAVFSWTYLTLFMYYHSTNYSFLGILLAAFGTQNMLASCAATDFDPSAAYGGIVNIIVAISVMIGVDTILASQSAADKAVAQLKVAWSMLEQAMRTHFSHADADLTTRFHKGEVLGAINATSALNDDANTEPRFYRSPWKNELFSSALVTIRILRFHMTLMEYGAAEGRTNGAPKHKAFLRVVKVPSIAAIQSCLYLKFEMIQHLTEIFLREPYESRDVRQHPKLLADFERDFGAEEKANTKKFFADAVSSPLFSEQEANIITMEDDPAVQAMLVIACSNAMIRQMNDLQKLLYAA